jgi:hydrogenase/urease accessory protein HupE
MMFPWHHKPYLACRCLSWLCAILWSAYWLGRRAWAWTMAYLPLVILGVLFLLGGMLCLLFVLLKETRRI